MVQSQVPRVLCYDLPLWPEVRARRAVCMLHAVRANMACSVAVPLEEC